MKKKYYPIIIALICTIVSIIIAVTKEKLSFVTLSDYLFLFTLLFVIIGGFLWVMASGFFDFFQQSVRRAVARKEKRDLPYMKFSEVGKGQYPFWLTTAGCLLLGSLFFLALSFI